jgi:hypothetical protein
MYIMYMYTVIYVQDSAEGATFVVNYESTYM